MKRFRIDFTCQELDCPPEEAQGIKFGDEVAVSDIFEFFNKCRDAAMTLFNSALPKKPKGEDPEVTKLKAELGLQRLENQRLKQELERIKQAQLPHDQAPWEYRKSDRYRMAADRGIPDDGSRGGDGPPSKEYLDAMKHAMNPDKDRY